MHPLCKRWLEEANRLSAMAYRHKVDEATAYSNRARQLRKCAEELDSYAKEQGESRAV